MAKQSTKGKSLKTISLPISDIQLDPSNVRKHDKKNIKALVASLKRFGQQKPIVLDKNNIVRAGNGTLTAAQELGWTHINAVVSDLEPSELTAYAIADNRTAELAEWDLEGLGEQLKSLDEELAEIAYEDFEYPDDPVEPSEKDDEVPETAENEFGVKLGDIWQLGEHRLMCGDSTDKACVDKLMDGAKADVVFTDPPYGMNLNTNYSRLPNLFGKGKKFAPIKGDNQDFDAGFILNNFEYCKEIILFGADYYSHSLPSNSGSWYVWDKRETEKFDAMMGNAFELAWSKSKHKREIARFNNTLFSGEAEAKNKVHPTQKPTRMILWFFERLKGDLVVDLFLGSGSTLIACEKTNRKCYGMEIDPHYCSVIIKRWQDFTGKEARRAAL